VPPRRVQAVVALRRACLLAAATSRALVITEIARCLRAVLSAWAPRLVGMTANCSLLLGCALNSELALSLGKRLNLLLLARGDYLAALVSVLTRLLWRCWLVCLVRKPDASLHAPRRLRRVRWHLAACLTGWLASGRRLTSRRLCSHVRRSPAGLSAWACALDETVACHLVGRRRYSHVRRSPAGLSTWARALNEPSACCLRRCSHIRRSPVGLSSWARALNGPSTCRLVGRRLCSHVRRSPAGLSA